MPEQKDLSEHYFEKYRTMTGLANKVLTGAVLVLAINWLFSLEPGYYAFRENQVLYKKKLEEARREINAKFIQRDLIVKDRSAEWGKLIHLQDSLKNKKRNDTALIQESAKIANTVKELDTVIARVDTSIARVQDSVASWKKKRSALLDGRSPSISKDLKDSSYESLIKFVFVVAADPREGSLYLMGLVLFIMVFGFTSRYYALHILAKAVRLFKDEASPGDEFKDHRLTAPYWLAPIPRNDTRYPKVNPAHISNSDLLLVMDWNFTKNTRKLFLIVSLVLLLVLESRFIYICLHTNATIKFDNLFMIGMSLSLVSLTVTVLWLLPLRVDDHLNTEQPANLLHRRVVISGIGMVVAAGLLNWRLDEISFEMRMNKKRFVHKNKKRRPILKSDMQQGIYVRTNKDSRKELYYFDKHGFSTLLKRFYNTEALRTFTSALVKVDLTKLGDANYPFYRLGTIGSYNLNKIDSWQFTKIIHELLAIHKPTGIDLLDCRLSMNDTNKNKHIDFKILDMGAKLFVIQDARDKRFEKFLEWWKELAASEAFHDVPKLKERLAMWKSTSWQEKIRNGS